MSQLSSAGHLAATAMLLLFAAAATTGSGLPSALAEAALPPCQKDIDALQTTCLKFVQKNGPIVPPSPECCAIVKALSSTAVPCVCHYLGSPASRDNISMEKVLFVTKKCGVTIPGNCGESKEV